MSTDDLPGDARKRLIDDAGLLICSERVGGPMGSASWRLTNNVVDIEIYSDRGSFGAAAGKHGRPTFDAAVWARALSEPEPGNLGIRAQIDFFADRLDTITSLIQDDPLCETRLKDINLAMAKDRLGLA